MKYNWTVVISLIVNILLIVSLIISLREVRGLSEKLDSVQRPVQIFDCEYKYNGAML